MAWATWREATARALYADGGFYRRTKGGPRDHFRTSVHASPLFATAILTLLRSTGLRAVVDVGSGGGELLLALHAADPSLDLTGVDIATRPPELPPEIGWTDDLPHGTDGLLIANEWLDDVPLDVVELTADGPRVVEVDSTGAERLGDAPTPEDLSWLERWWPLQEVGDRAEVGLPRDVAWAAAVRSVRRGLAVAIDYAHFAETRPPRGSLTGYRSGRQVRPVPDGSCDITSFVALDACAAAGLAAGADSTLLTTQRSALRSLGVAPVRPAHALATTDPAAYLRALTEIGEAAELTAEGGLGDFGWLIQAVDVPLPRS